MKTFIQNVLLVLVLLVGVNQTAAQVNFTNASSPSVGSVPYSVTSADVNGDGKPDLISANQGDNTLTVLTNNGSGGFLLSSSPTAGSQPYSVTAADVNGDGKLDLISANLNANTLTVLTNNGSGGFLLSSSPTVGSQPFSVTAADVNGDGKMDLISASHGDNTLTVLTNNGSGGFVLASSPTVGSYPYSVTAADLNGDGKPDLISANFGGNTLTVLTNNGSGGFALASSPTVGNKPISVTSADVNGDGKPDLISANYNNGFGNSLTVLTNNGSGGFLLSSSPTVGSEPYSVTSADVNGDGKADLISANYNASTLTILTNDGSGGFVTAASPGVGYAPSSVVSADVNGDGKPDLISANYGGGSGNTLTVLINNSVFPSSVLTGIVVNPTNAIAVLGVTPNQQFTVTGYYDDGSFRTVAGGSTSSSSNWVAVAGMPAAKSGAACAAVNGKLYAVSGSLDPTVFEYNPALNVWTNIAALDDNFAYAGAAGIGNKLYFMGGMRNGDGAFTSTQLRIYDATTKTWVNGAPLLFARAGMAVGVINGKIYVAGGFGGSFGTVELQVYNPASNVWTTAHSLPAPVEYCGGAVVNNKLYVVGGSSNGSDLLATLYAYDPNTDNWAAKATLPTPRAYLGATAVNGLLYAIDGNAPTGETNLVQIYNPAADTWSTGVPTLMKHSLSQPVAINGTIYVAGNGPGNTPVTNMEAYAVQTSLAWSSSNPGVASVNTNGLATGLSSGVTTITATFGNFSSSATLNVGALPVITAQPTNNTVLPNGSVTLSVGASGTGLTYQWQLNGTNISGATGSSLTISNLTSANVGIYRVVVSSAVGSTYSQSVTLATVGIQMFAGVVVNGPIGSSYLIQTMNNFANSNWTTLTNVVLPGQPYIYIDYGSPTNSQRFYRAVPQ